MNKHPILDTINDVFVITKSGIPLYASCFGGEICSKKPDHLLQSGFISAMFSFAKEFGQKSIIMVEFEEGRMFFAPKSIQDNEFIVVFFTTNEPDLESIKTIISKSADLFEAKYGQKFIASRNLIETKDFEGFTMDLLSAGFMNRNPMGNLATMLSGKKKKKFIFF